MFTEIKEAVNFIAKYLLGNVPRRPVGLFTQQLANHLALRYAELWNLDDPKSGEDSRVVRIRCGGVTDQILLTAAREVAIDVQELLECMPENLMLFVNPGEVYFKRNDRSIPCPVWMGKIDADQDYRSLPAHVLEPRDETLQSTSNMGAAGKTMHGTGPGVNSTGCYVDDAYVPIPLESIHPAAAPSSLLAHNMSQQFVFLPVGHQSLTVGEFAATRFGCQRQRPDHNTMRRLQEQAALGRGDCSEGTMITGSSSVEKKHVLLMSPAFDQNQNFSVSGMEGMKRLSIEQRELIIRYLTLLNINSEKMEKEASSPPTTVDPFRSNSSTNSSGSPGSVSSMFSSMSGGPDCLKISKSVWDPSFV